MDVHDGLAGALVAVDAEIIAVGRIFLVEQLFTLVQKVVHRKLLFGSYIEIDLDVTLRDYQKMTRVYRHHVEHRICDFILRHVVFTLAK